MNKEPYDNIYPVIFPRSKEDDLKKDNIYLERVLDGLVVFVAQTQTDPDRYQFITTPHVGPDKIPKELLWKSALKNLFEVIHADWDPEHAYIIISSKPKDFGAAGLLHPYLHEYLVKQFGEEYIVLPYSTEYLIAMPMLSPDEILEGFRDDLQENPEPFPLSNRIYLVEDGVTTVYPDTSSDFVPVVLEDPKEKEKKNKRRKKHGIKQHYFM